jgi:hypothetical protein
MPDALPDVTLPISRFETGFNNGGHCETEHLGGKEEAFNRD